MHDSMQAVYVTTPPVAGGIVTPSAFVGAEWLMNLSIKIIPTGVFGEAVLDQDGIGRFGLDGYLVNYSDKPVKTRADGSLTSEIDFSKARPYFGQVWLSRRKAKHKPS
jgi:hypothetical protein